MGRTLLTPSKVTAWLDCEHSLALQRLVDSGEMERPSRGLGEFARLVMAKGEQHEAECLASYVDNGVDVFSVSERRAGEPFDAWVDRVGDVLAAGHDVVFQMPFVHGGMRGIADFLERVDLPNGVSTYEPVDAKLARSDAKPGHVLQLAFYADAIEASVGSLPENMHVWLGSGQRETIRTREVRAYWHRMRARLLDAVASDEPADTEPVPCRYCDFCEFAAHCDQVWRDQDALHYVAGIRKTDAQALQAAGTTSLTELSSSEEAVEELEESRLQRVRRQAALQLEARSLTDGSAPPFENIEPGEDRPWGYGYELLPAPDDGDVFLDFEGHPFWRADAGLFFLFGFIAKDGEGHWSYQARWAHDLEEERRAATWLVDTLYDRIEAYPAAHVYHYNHTERSALQALFTRHDLDDTKLSVLVRQGAFVDLLEVVRNAVQIGAESYGLKEVEQLAGFARGHDITKGSGAVIEYDGFMSETPAADRAGLDHSSVDALRSIAAYNEDDVRATMAVRDWLVAVRPADAPWRAAQLDEVTRDEERDVLVEALRELDGPGERLLADLLGYWRREGSAHAAQLRARAESPPGRLLHDEEAIVRLHSGQDVKRLTPTGKEAKHPALELRFPPQPVAPFQKGMYLSDEGTSAYCTVHHLEPRAGRLVLELNEGGRERGDRPQTVVANDWVDPSSKRPALTDWAQAVVAAGGLAGLDDARSRLLRREPPRFLRGGGPADGLFTDDLDATLGWVDALDRSWFAVQGPPGTGKTYRAARIIHHLVMGGKRVGITAMSHAAIQNLVAEVHRAFEESGDGDSLRAVVRGHPAGPPPLPGVTYANDNPACAKDEFNVVAGTTWLFASSALQAHPVDVLVVDEAGQLALVDVLAAGGAATDLLLLGDPQQLAQVSLAAHPNGSGDSVLEHVLAGAKTLSPRDGVFLSETRRMHAQIVEFISEQFYEGRLGSHPSCSLQSTHRGVGLRWLRADHAGNSTRAPEEVELVVLEARRLLMGGWTDSEGRDRELRPEDIIVVTPYNDQKDALSQGLRAAGLGAVRAGTVDKFQGQEAAVVFFSAATSSAETASRGLGFVFSRNRFNVAISRARCLAYLICTSEVLDATARTVDEMKTLASACAFVAAATEPSPSADGSR